MADRFCMVGGTILASVVERSLQLQVNNVPVPPHLPSTCEHADTAVLLPGSASMPITDQYAAAPTHFRPGRWRLPFLLKRSDIALVDGQRESRSPADSSSTSDGHQQTTDAHEHVSTLAPGHSLFTVFNEQYNAKVFVRTSAASIWDLIELATHTIAAGRAFSYRILRFVLPGWPEPQIVIWHDLSVDHLVLPVQAPTPLGVCTIRVPKASNAFAVAVEVCHKCRLDSSLFQDVARRDITVMVNWQAQLPFADHYLFDADSASLVSEDIEAPSLRRSRGQPIRRLLQTMPRAAYTDAESIPEVFVHVPAGHSHRVEIPSHYRPAQTMHAAAAATGNSHARRLLFLEHSPVCYGTPPHAILTDAQHLPDGHRWILIDLRRVCVPPYPFFFVMPAPPLVDLPWVRCALRYNFPRLPHFFVAYLDDTLLDRPCALQASAPLLTVTPLLPGSTDRLLLEAPALLDTCSELLTRSGYRALFDAAHDCTFAQSAMAATSTTTTGMQQATDEGLPFGALLDPITRIQSVPLEVFAASARTRFVSCTVTGNVVLEDLLSFVTMQIDELQEVYNADRCAIVPRIFFGPDGKPAMFMAFSNPDSPTAVFLPHPVLVNVYAPALVSHICAILNRPDLRAYHWAWNGVVWDGMLVHLARGDVITVRPHCSALFTAPLNLLRLRVIGVQAGLFDLTGPQAPDTAGTGFSYRFSPCTSQVRTHWASICAAVCPLFGDQPEFSKVLLLGHGLPPIRCALPEHVCLPQKVKCKSLMTRISPPFSVDERGVTPARLMASTVSLLMQTAMPIVKERG